MYPVDHCHFCQSKLIEAKNKSCYYCCNCEHKYNILVFRNGRFSVLFYIKNFKFNISEHHTNIVDLAKDKKTYDVFSADIALFIDNKNYLDVIDRLKNLQIFK